MLSTRKRSRNKKNNNKKMNNKVMEDLSSSILPFFFCVSRKQTRLFTRYPSVCNVTICICCPPNNLSFHRFLFGKGTCCGKNKDHKEYYKLALQDSVSLSDQLLSSQQQEDTGRLSQLLLYTIVDGLFQQRGDVLLFHHVPILPLLLDNDNFSIFVPFFLPVKANLMLRT
jgi:hypothetical protein